MKTYLDNPFKCKKIEIYGHRGAAGLAPENALPAFETAIRLGVDAIDMDVVMTKDYIVVAHHDPFISPAITRDSAGNWISNQGLKIKELTFAELQTYDVGKINPNDAYFNKFPDRVAIDNTKIPSLEQVISFANSLNNKIRLQIEIKTDPRYPEQMHQPKEIVPEILQVINKLGVAGRTEIHSFDWRNMLLIQQQDKQVTTSYISEQQPHFNNIEFDKEVNVSWTADYNVADYNNSVAQMIHTLGGKVWCPNFRDVTPENVATAQQLGLRVVPWSVDLEEEMKRMLSCNVDAIITNRPDILRGILTVYGIPVPKTL